MLLVLLAVQAVTGRIAAIDDNPKPVQQLLGHTNHLMRHLLQSSATCEDAHPNCPMWGELGWCDADVSTELYKVSQKNCKKTCGICGDGMDLVFTMRMLRVFG